MPGKPAIQASVPDFMMDLSARAPAVGQGCFAFPDGQGKSRGFVQLIADSGNRITIHRVWTLEPGAGNGTVMLRALCDLADRHGVEMRLRPLPFGRKPYPFDRDQLIGWYQRYGFHGNRRKMIRPPGSTPATSVGKRLPAPPHRDGNPSSESH